MCLFLHVSFLLTPPSSVFFNQIHRSPSTCGSTCIPHILTHHGPSCVPPTLNQYNSSCVPPAFTHHAHLCPCITTHHVLPWVPSQPTMAHHVPYYEPVLTQTMSLAMVLALNLQQCSHSFVSFISQFVSTQTLHSVILCIRFDLSFC